MSARAIVVAGTASGVGKTTLTIGLLEAYRRRGLTVQAFKVGPDFIDPGFHTLVTGRPSYNLDGWMCGREHVLATVARRCADADLAVIEGVMGCFDGAEATGDEGSTAEVAKWLGAPVLLVIDGSALARTAAAVVRGFETFDPELRLAAVIANRVGGPGHARLIDTALRRHCRAVPVGTLPADPALALPERHLGLVTAVEGSLGNALRARLALAIESSVDLDQLLALAAPLPGADSAGAGERGRSERSVRIAIARDAAFQFYYAENLERLASAGAELVFWSPLTDPAVPDVDGLYFGGGYPELHAHALADNASARKAVRELAAVGVPIYAECGGLMYLAEALEDMEGVAHPMVGLLPATVRMQPRRLTLGYREARFSRNTPLGPAGTVARGHEFHCSTLDVPPPSVARAYQPGEAYLIGGALLSYVHLHFGSNPSLAPNFVAACANARC